MLETDKQYFEQYPQPIFEASMRGHFGPINHSTPYYGPFLYWLARCSGARFVVEIGVCKAYTSFFLASAVKDNMTRQGVDNGRYWGVDISGEIPEFERKMREKGLPVNMLQMDSWDLKPETFDGNKLGVAFIDGWHSRQHLLKEVEILYPLLVDGGRGYMVIHDTYGWVSEPIVEVLKDPRYEFEHISFADNYGLTILRKVKDYKFDPRAVWPQGPEPDIKPGEDYYDGAKK